MEVRLENAPVAIVDAGYAPQDRSTTVDAKLTYMRVSNTPHPEFVLLDETLWAVDLSMPPDGSATGTHTPTTQQVDRSYQMYKLGVTASHEFGPVGLGVGYERRLKRFGSSDPYDVGHFDRLDTRHVLGASATYHLSSGWRVALAYKYTTQSTRRAPAPGMTLTRPMYNIDSVWAELTAT